MVDFNKYINIFYELYYFEYILTNRVSRGFFDVNNNFIDV